MEKTIDIEELVQDDHNLNRGTEEGQRLMERSFKELGAGRSILVDRDGRIIAGNKSQKAAMAAGIKRVRVVETTGDELIAVKRTDLSLDSKEGRELAYADNLTTQGKMAPIWIRPKEQECPIDEPVLMMLNYDDLPDTVVGFIDEFKDIHIADDEYAYIKANVSDLLAWYPLPHFKEDE